MPKYELFTTAEVPDFPSLRSYVGYSKAVSVSDVTTGGLFLHDETDSSTSDDDENTVVDYKGRRWKKLGAGNVSFLQSGTGAVRRSAQDKMRDIVSVKDFDAFADGATDDGPAFQRAIDAGFAVYVPADTYAVNTAITFPTQPRLQGAGIERTIINTDIPGDSVFKYDSAGVSFPHVSHMTIRGNGLRGASGSGHCFACISPTPGSGTLTPQQAVFECLRIEDFLGTDDSDETGVSKIASCAIYQYSTISNTARKVYISDCGHGIVMRKTQNCLIDDCVVIECDKAGIYAHDNDRLVIDNCDILKCGESVSYSSVTISNASPGVVTWAAHGLSNGDLIDLRTTGSLPTGLAINTTYYVVNATADTFELSATSGGASINTSSAGSGTHYAMSGADTGYPTPDAQLIGNIVSYANNALVVSRTKVKGFKGKAAMVFKGDGRSITVGPANWLRGDAQIDMPHKTIYAERISGLSIIGNLFTPSNTGFSATQSYETIELYQPSVAPAFDSLIEGNVFEEASGFPIAYNIKIAGNASTRTHRATVRSNRFGTNSSRSAATTITADITIVSCTLEEGSYIGENSFYAPTNVTRAVCLQRNAATFRGDRIFERNLFQSSGGTITAEYSDIAEQGSVVVRGDVAATLQVGVNARTQIWNSALTADRAVTLSATGAVDGDEFEIIRTAAATGAFNLNIGHSAGTKALTAGQYARFKYSGTLAAWVLVDAGSL